MKKLQRGHDAIAVACNFTCALKLLAAHCHNGPT